MPEPHLALNALPSDEARQTLTRCCGSARWVEAMLGRRPFASSAALHAAAEAIWVGLERQDFLEAFAHHPKIGTEIGSQGSPPAGDERLAATAAWSRQEQARVAEADDGIKNALAAANAAYLRRFGFIFIVCATGKSAGEMLGLLEARLQNDPTRELLIAAGEQARITRLRLEKLAI
jgi:2-oxo-4-hydroxy-4-carboxy-5-ureidoimidazoline decarboxylase